MHTTAVKTLIFVLFILTRNIMLYKNCLNEKKIKTLKRT